MNYQNVAVNQSDSSLVFTNSLGQSINATCSVLSNPIPSFATGYTPSSVTSDGKGGYVNQDGFSINVNRIYVSPITGGLNDYLGITLDPSFTYLSPNGASISYTGVTVIVVYSIPSYLYGYVPQNTTITPSGAV